VGWHAGWSWGLLYVERWFQALMSG